PQVDVVSRHSFRVRTAELAKRLHASPVRASRWAKRSFATVPAPAAYDRCVRTLGIDLAAQPANTSACAIDWGPGTPVVSDLSSGLDDTALLDAIDGADKVGIDAPFGWPDDFVRAVSAHQNR